MNSCYQQQFVSGAGIILAFYFVEVYMIDPVIFRIPFVDWPVYWYGVILMTGFLVGCWLVERELTRRGENGELIWDLSIWILIPGVVGARVWYVVNATLGGSTVFSANPMEIFNIRAGGLHIFGAFLFGAAAMMLYMRKNNLDPWLFLDAAAPALLIGQALGRWGNFINQELYGPPTTLPWGLQIHPENPYQIPFEVQGQSRQAIEAYLETTRFHPTFAYEMLWNFAAAGLLLWLGRRYEKDLKPGTLFAGWLVLAGIGRSWIELFRPDQPKIGDSIISYSMIGAALMAITGAIILLARYKAIKLQAAEGWEEEYQLSTQPKVVEVEEVSDENEMEAEVEPKIAKPKATKAKAKPSTSKKTAAGSNGSRTATKPKTTRAKKS